MNEFQLEESVKTKRDIPELDLQQGSIGVIRSIWHMSVEAYEIEFITPHVRGLLMADQLERLHD